MKTGIKIGIVMLVMGILCSCSKEEDAALIQDTKASISSLSPSKGPKETLVTISGKNFGADINGLMVFFNDREAIVESIKDTQIVVKVPVMGQTGQVHLQTALDEIITGPQFVYEYTADVTTYIGADAEMRSPRGIAIDSDGRLYIADKFNNRILTKGPASEVEVFAGSTQGMVDGPIDQAKFYNPEGVAVDDLGNVYVADSGNSRIRKITPDGMVNTLAGARSGDADGSGLFAQFKHPVRIAIDTSGDLYVSDAGNNRIRKVSPEGDVITFAGSSKGTADGVGTTAQFYNPMGLTLDDQGVIYVADNENQRIRVVTPEGLVTTLSGSTEGFENGALETALFDYPSDVVFDTFGNLIIADTDNHQIRWISPEGSVKTLAGSSQGQIDGKGTEAKFKNPYGICKGPDGIFYVTDTGNNTIRKITLE
ncbi:IPT/TIG domain-containing protein [Flagellimonas algicola]|uniref:IPT/TIG domain-containing protein n=1 Tax=Flagellimonas algicola TaxID=2583815 RepID=A0ABY2WJT2_9FLAO|nr:IPT/TIG domain-containing protein [Allomuricauda algicola]TMU54679.1 hypothetical protein FGG15_10770 [Allomuricauda algicola]